MILFLVLLLLLIAVLGGAFYAYYVAFYSPKSKRNLPPRFDRKSYAPYREELESGYQQLRQREWDSVTISSREGLKLRGHYCHVADGAPLDIGFHGYRSSPFLDFCGGAGLSFEMGHNLLLVDQRAHGESEGYSITFGIREREDVLCWVDYARERFGPEVKILLYGVSMGASTVLMASELDLPVIWLLKAWRQASYGRSSAPMDSSNLKALLLMQPSVLSCFAESFFMIRIRLSV